MITLVRRFIREDAGQDMIEYGLLAALLSIVAYSIIQSIGQDVSTIYGPVVGGTTNAAAS